MTIRESSDAAYTASMGRRVEAFAYVDDGEHYGQGMDDLRTILQELGLGSQVTGIGFSWAKFSAYSTGWDDEVARISGADNGLSADQVMASGWNIWTGGISAAAIPRARSNDIEKLLGKRGCIQDKHSTAAAETIAKVTKIRNALSNLRCSWDEVSESLQFIVAGVLCYAPWVGIPLPTDLHKEDQAFQRIILRDMRVRSTVERTSLAAPVGAGGVQVPVLVECMITAVARDLLLLLSGTSRCAQLARDALRQVMEGQLPDDAPRGLVSRACDFLAGYGLYLTCSADRTVGRILDVLQASAGVRGHPMTGPFSQAAFEAGFVYSRTGRLATCLRQVVSSLRNNGIPLGQWHTHMGRWEQRIVAGCGATARQCLDAAVIATAQAQADWETEAAIFHQAHPLSCWKTGVQRLGNSHGYQP